MYQNYFDQFRDKGNVIAERVRIFYRVLGFVGGILSDTGLNSFNAR